MAMMYIIILPQDASNPNNINLSRNLFDDVMEYAKLIDDGTGKTDTG